MNSCIRRLLLPSCHMTRIISNRWLGSMCCSCSREGPSRPRSWWWSGKRRRGRWRRTTALRRTAARRVNDPMTPADAYTITRDADTPDTCYATRQSDSAGGPSMFQPFPPAPPPPRHNIDRFVLGCTGTIKFLHYLYTTPVPQHLLEVSHNDPRGPPNIDPV